jgi:hypothetical protein
MMAVAMGTTPRSGWNRTVLSRPSRAAVSRSSGVGPVGALLLPELVVRWRRGWAVCVALATVGRCGCDARWRGGAVGRRGCDARWRGGPGPARVRRTPATGWCPGRPEVRSSCRGHRGQQSGAVVPVEEHCGTTRVGSRVASSESDCRLTCDDALGEGQSHALRAVGTGGTAAMFGSADTRPGGQDGPQRRCSRVTGARRAPRLPARGRERRRRVRHRANRPS